MPRFNAHNANHVIANHSIYQAESSIDSNKILQEIATNTKSINLNVDTLEVNTDTLETKIAETNTKLAAQKTVLDSMLVDTDAIDSSCNTIEAQSVLTASRLNNIQNKLSVNTDGTGDTLGQINSNILTAVEGTLNVDIASALPAGSNAIGKLAANSGVDIGDVDVTSISAGSNRIGMVALKANEAVDGSGTERHVLCDAAGHLQVDVLSGGGSTDVSALSTHAKQDTIIGHLDGVEGKLDHLSDNIDTLDAVQDNALTKLG